MSLQSCTNTLALGTLLAAAVAMPIAGAFADESANATNNATIDDRCKDATLGSGTSGAYDNFDAFRDATGRPCSGWEYLFFAPS